MTGPLVRLVARQAKENRRLRADNAALQEQADETRRLWLDERTRRVDLELLVGWTEDA